MTFLGVKQCDVKVTQHYATASYFHVNANALVAAWLKQKPWFFDSNNDILIIVPPTLRFHTPPPPAWRMLSKAIWRATTALCTCSSTTWRLKPASFGLRLRNACRKKTVWSKGHEITPRYTHSSHKFWKKVNSSNKTSRERKKINLRNAYQSPNRPNLTTFTKARALANANGNGKGNSAAFSVTAETAAPNQLGFVIRRSKYRASWPWRLVGCPETALLSVRCD